jgi:hypothetical protein
MLDFNDSNGTRFPEWPPRPAIPRLDPPLVEVVRRGRQLTVIECPWCHERFTHHHGDAGREGCGDFGHRLSHCWRGPWARNNPGYVLYLPCPEEPPPQRARDHRRAWPCRPRAPA